MWTKILLNILTLSVLANADLDKLPGPCPVAKPVEHFDEQRYGTGPWYTVVHTNPPEDACIHFTITFSPEKIFRQIGIKNGVKSDRSIPFINEAPGHFKVNIPGGLTGQGVILATDYDKYSVHYACKFDASDNTHTNKLYINVRENYVKDPAGQIAVGKAAIEAGGLELGDNYKLIPHENCDDH